MYYVINSILMSIRQGIKWIKSRYGDSLVVIRLTQRNYLDRIERAVSNGDVVLLENIGESVDAVLEPLLGRVLIRKGRVLKVDKYWEHNKKNLENTSCRIFSLYKNYKLCSDCRTSVSYSSGSELNMKLIMRKVTVSDW